MLETMIEDKIRQEVAQIVRCNLEDKIKIDAVMALIRRVDRNSSLPVDQQNWSELKIPPAKCG